MEFSLSVARFCARRRSRKGFLELITQKLRGRLFVLEFNPLSLNIAYFHCTIFLQKCCNTPYRLGSMERARSERAVWCRS